MKSISLFLSLLFCILSLVCMAESENTLTDDFESGLGKWDTPVNRFIEASEGQLTNKTVYASGIGLKEKNMGDFKMSFRLKFLKNTEKTAGHFSIGIDRGYGVWNLYFTATGDISQVTSKFVPAEDDSKAKPLFDEVINTQMPLEKWLDIVITCNSSGYELQIDGRSFLLGTAPGRGGISIGSYRQPFAMDNLKIVFSQPGGLSQNLMPNSSFEHASNPDIPDCWAGTGIRYRTNGIPAGMNTETGIAEFRGKFFLDDKQARYGKRSIRIEAPFHLLGEPQKVVLQKDYTASCYMKSDIQDRHVQIGVTNDSMGKPVADKVVVVGTEWQRYEIQLPVYPHALLSFFARPLDSGKIWLDGIQIEKGGKSTQYMECWYDTGFSLPGDVNINQCKSNVNGIRGTLERRDVISSGDLKISGMELISKNPLTHTFDLEFGLANTGVEDASFTVTAAITSKSNKEQLRICRKEIAVDKTGKIRFEDIILSADRCCVNIAVMDLTGATIKQTREFIDVPHPMIMYPEYSFYTVENEARIVVQFSGNVLEKLGGGKIQFEVFLPGYPQYPCRKNTFDINSSVQKNIFSIPLSRLSPNIYTVKAVVLDRNGKPVMEAENRLVTAPSSNTEVKINRINRGVYVNGKPFLPYGILVSGLNRDEMQYYKKCGFSYIQFISNWNKPETNMVFLEDCERLGFDAIAFHVSRPYTMAPNTAAGMYRVSPAFVGMVPNDECSADIVYEEADSVKQAAPERLTWVNHHFHSYRSFAGRLEGFPGDILSIDRYPFILQPPGRPQVTGDIYSFEQCLQMIEKDSVRERKPCFIWLQGAERFSKEPTSQQLVWQTYIALVNHCMGFTYFGGIPHSKYAWEKIIELNREVQTLKPALFSLAEDPEIKAVDDVTRENISFIAKKLGSELTVICVNRSIYPTDATLCIAEAGIKGSRTVEVLFENRQLKTDENTCLKDRFEPLARHVYKIKLK